MSEDTSYNLFQVETAPRRWKKPTANEPKSPTVGHLNTDWLGSSFSDLSSSPVRRSSKIDNSWLVAANVQRPEPIKIEGSNSVRSNPFFGK